MNPYSEENYAGFEVVSDMRQVPVYIFYDTAGDVLLMCDATEVAGVHGAWLLFERLFHFWASLTGDKEGTSPWALRASYGEERVASI